MTASAVKGGGSEVLPRALPKRYVEPMCVTVLQIDEDPDTDTDVCVLQI